MEKKPWVTPELIILGKSRIEETVLESSCKTGPLSTGPSNNSQGCGTTQFTNCGACQGRSDSGS